MSNTHRRRPTHAESYVDREHRALRRLTRICLDDAQLALRAALRAERAARAALLREEYNRARYLSMLARGRRARSEKHAEMARFLEGVR